MSEQALELGESMHIGKFLNARIEELLSMNVPSIEQRLLFDEPNSPPFFWIKPLEAYDIHRPTNGESIQELLQRMEDFLVINLTLDEVLRSKHLLTEFAAKMKKKAFIIEKCRLLQGRMRWVLDKKEPSDPTDEEFDIANAIGAADYFLRILDGVRQHFRYLD